jgi:hypothetical protein
MSCACGNPTTVDERTPMTHAKLWKTSTHLAIGSWNFTRAGSNSLLDSRGKRLPGNNIEAGFILPNNSAVESVLGATMDTSPALFLSDEALQAQALKIPQNLPLTSWWSSTGRSRFTNCAANGI